MGHFNLIRLIGFYSLKLSKIKIVNGKIEFVNGKFEVSNSVGTIQKRLKKDYSSIFMKKIIEKIKVKKVEVFFSGGISDNSFASAILCGGVSSAVLSIFAIISNIYESAGLYEDIDVKFNQSEIELTFDIVVEISLIRVLISAIVSFFEINDLRRSKNEN